MRARWALTAAAVLLIGVAFASADPITITQDQRFTMTDANPGHLVARADAADTLSSTSIASSGSGTSQATLASSFRDPMRWFGAGTANVTWTIPPAASDDASSVFGVRFQVSSPVTYDFNGTFTASASLVPPDNGAMLARAGVTLQEFGGGNAQIFDFGLLQPGSNATADRTFTGSLLPGQYLFRANASAGGFTFGTNGGTGVGNGAGAFAFTLDFTPAESPSPTPEPATLLLLGTAVAGVFGCRRLSNRFE
jgi:hypothetical protein